MKLDEANGSPSGSPSSPVDSELPVEVASMFYTGLNEPKPTGMDFSLDGLFFASSHNDDALRVIDVSTLSHKDTIISETSGIHCARFTQSSAVVCVCPRHPLDGHLRLLNLETAQFIGAMAYVNLLEGEIRPEVNTPVYSSIAQCPCTDVLAAVVTTKGRLALFHPLISGAVAASPEKSITGGRATLSFGADGCTLLVGDDRCVRVLDRRMLAAPPVAVLQNTEVFSENATLARCKGAELNTDGAHLLLTSSFGEVVVYNWKTQEIVSNYYHDDAKRHFLGSGDAIGAQYTHPGLRSSCIAQPTSSMNGGRHLIVYAGLPSPPETPQPSGRLLYELQSKDSDVPVALVVNRRFSLLATAARNVTWWSFNCQ